MQQTTLVEFNRVWSIELIHKEVWSIRHLKSRRRRPSRCKALNRFASVQERLFKKTIFIQLRLCKSSVLSQDKNEDSKIPLVTRTDVQNAYNEQEKLSSQNSSVSLESVNRKYYYIKILHIFHRTSPHDIQQHLTKLKTPSRTKCNAQLLLAVKVQI